MASPADQSAPDASTPAVAKGFIARILTAVLAHIPETKAFHARRDEDIRSLEETTEKRLKRIDLPQDSVTWMVLKGSFVTPYARIEFWKNEVHDWIGNFVLLLLLLVYVASPIIANRVFLRPGVSGQFLHLSASVWFNVGTYACLLAAISLFVFLLFLSSTVFGGLSQSQLTPNVTVVLNASFPAVYVCCLLLLAYRLRRMFPAPTVTSSLVTTCALGTCIFAAAILLALFVDRFVSSLVEKQASLSHPEVRLFACLTYGVLPLLDFKFRDFRFTRQVLESLEEAASLLEGPFAARVRTEDPGTDSWLDREMKKRAAAVREMKKMVVFAKGSAPPELDARARSMLIHVCNLDWQSLDRAPMQELSKRERALQLKNQITRGIGVVAVPLVLLLLVTLVRPIRELDTSHGLFVGAILFLAISVLSVLDPEFSKSVIKLMAPFVGGKSKESGTD